VISGMVAGYKQKVQAAELDWAGLVDIER